MVGTRERHTIRDAHFYLVPIVDPLQEFCGRNMSAGQHVSLGWFGTQHAEIVIRHIPSTRSRRALSPRCNLNDSPAGLLPVLRLNGGGPTKVVLLTQIVCDSTV